MAGPKIPVKFPKTFCELGEDGRGPRYLDRLGLNHGYLVIFDPRDKDWEEKLYFKDIAHKDKNIAIVGL